MTENERSEMQLQCLQFRRAVGAEPGLENPQVEAHAAACTSCADYRRQMRSLDGVIRRALAIPVPAGRSRPSSAPGVDKPPHTRRWFALAASLLAAAGIGFALWSTAPRESLATTVVEHVRHEPDALVTTADRVAPFALEDILAKSGVRMRGNLDTVSYARSCPIRGHWVPHLVVQTGAGPVTVLVMAQEHVRQPVPLHTAGLTGTIVPAGPGSIAIIGSGPVPVDEVRDRVLEAVEFLETGQ